MGKTAGAYVGGAIVMTGGNGKGGRRCNGEIKRKGGYEKQRMNERDRGGWRKLRRGDERRAEE